jgi:uncharacterized protein
MLIEKDIVVTEFARRVRSALGANLHAIYLFGSRAGGDSRPDSDYDFLLESRERVSEQERDRVADITVDISGRNGVLLDIHYALCEKLHGVKRFLTPFRSEVLTKGIPL